jgi:pyruvate/2-oxoglutarate dehydrogenase complex dihydrolipoamide dehydrogenase (E3) component
MLPMHLAYNPQSRDSSRTEEHRVEFSKLVVDRATYRILACHVVGDRAVEIRQVAAIAIESDMRVNELAKVPLSFPTYAGILGRVAASATRQLNSKVNWLTNQTESFWC